MLTNAGLPFSSYSDSQSLTSDSEEDGRLRGADDHSRVSGSVRQYTSHRPQSGQDYDVTSISVSSVRPADPILLSNDPGILRPSLRPPQQRLDTYMMAMSGDQTSRDYDLLKSQNDWVMAELHSLRKQLADTGKKCEQSQKDADKYRQSYLLTKEKLDRLQSELNMAKSKYNDVVADQQRLQEEVNYLEKLHEEDRSEMMEIRQQQESPHAQDGSSIDSKIYEKYDALKQDYETLHKRSADVFATVNANSSKMELLQQDNTRLKKNYNEVVQEHEASYKSLQQHCTATIQDAQREKKKLLEKLNVSDSDRMMYREQLKKVTAEKDIYFKDRNNAIYEYKLVMSERDSVHKEMEQLQDKLSDVEKKLALSDKEKKNSLDEIENLRREISSALHERDHMAKQLSELKEKYADLRELDLDRNGNHGITDYGRLPNDLGLAGLDGDHAKRNMDVYDPANDGLDKEAEGMRKEIDALQTELSDALQEVELAKRHRDWAFTERDKIVRERESIRTLCDKLRHERDNAVSKLAEAIRDSDELTKQKNEASKELKELRERHEALVEKEARKNQLHPIGTNHSQDSAIDTDMQEWEIETVELQIGGLDRDDLGFELVGGRDDRQFPNDNAIFVSSVRQDSRAYGKLRINDQLVKVNNLDVTNVDKIVALQTLRSGTPVIHLVVRRRKWSNTRTAHSVHITISPDRDLGVNFEQGLYVSRILPGTSAAKEGTLAIGDRVLNVNGHMVDNNSLAQVMQLLQESTDHVTLSVLKYASTPPGSCIVSSSSTSSGHLMESSPEALSLSPKSPHSRIWSPSPDSEKANLPLKSSGSQTDSLDSPRPAVRRAPEPKKKNMFERARGMFSRPFHSTDRSERDARCKSEHPCSPTSYGDASTEEDVVLGHFNDVINQYSKQSPTKSKERRRRVCREHENGTWPKCRGRIDLHDGTVYTPVGQFEHKSPRARRPALSTIIDPNTYRPLLSSSSSHDNKLAPTPPERADSFKRSGSIKHSPQSSDSTVKCMHVGHPEKAVGVTEQGSNSYIISSPQKPPLSHSIPPSSGHKKDRKQSCPDRTYAHRCSNVSSQPGESSHYNYSVGNTATLPHYPVSSSSSTHQPDLTVKSANQEDVFKYRRPRVQDRPNSAPSKTREKRREIAAQLHDKNHHRLAYPPQKPTTLDVKPIYSPRPLVRTAMNIPLSHPSTSLAASPNTMWSTSTAFPSSGNSSQPVSPRDKPPLYTHLSQVKTSQAKQARGPAPSHVLRSTNPAIHLAQGKPVVANSLPNTPLNNQPMSGTQCVSPNGQYGRFHRIGYTSSSIPEIDHDHVGPLSHNLRFRSPSPCSSQQSSSNLDQSITSTSDDFPYQPKPRPSVNSYCVNSGVFSTLPNTNKSRQACHHYTDHTRISPSIISSNQSDGRISVSSIDKVSDRSSPIFHARPYYEKGTTQSLPNEVRKRPDHGELRQIHMEKNAEPLGIQIGRGSSGGIFVSSVSDNTLAASAGITIGHQLLEVCGINFRTATYEDAAKILRHCRGSITMLVQYNPNKYMEGSASSSLDSTESSSDNESSEMGQKRKPLHHYSNDTITAEPASSNITSPSHGGKATEDSLLPHEPRFVMLKKKHPHMELGLVLAGGNAVGIFVKTVHSTNIASGPDALRVGDQILECNGVSFRSITAEQAYTEITKPVDTVSIRAQYHIAKYNKIKDQPGDSLYIRALFDRQSGSEGELSFRKDAILYVDDTLHGGVLGVWRVWELDEQGQKVRCGTIPSKSRLERELAMKRSFPEPGEDDLKSSRRSSASARRSFFKRRRHQRNNSKDSRELNSFSDASINSDSLTFLGDGSALTLEKVEQFDCSIWRPVLILGPLAHPLINKLTSESHDKFCRCEPELFKGTIAEVQESLTDGIFVDYRVWKPGHFECFAVQSIREIIDKNRHCMLNVHPDAIERLHRVQIYPIVLFIRHKSHRQIREVKDTQFFPEKLPSKAARELFDTFQEYEHKYKRYFSDIIPGGNLALMCCKIKSVIDREQKKCIWVPSGSL